MANGKALKKISQELNVALQYSSSYIEQVSEYLRYSRYGQLVIVDFGGIVAGSTSAYAVTFTNLPIIRTRFVIKLFQDTQGTAVPDGFAYSKMNSQNIYFVMPANKHMYGQAIYLTDRY